MKPTLRRRPGWSLLELLVVITAVSAMLTLAAMLIFQTLKVGQDERSSTVAAAALERLGGDLRADARAASGPLVLAPTRLVLPAPEGRSIEYTLDRRVALRTVRKGEKVERREQYRWPRGTAGRFEPMRDGPAEGVALALVPDEAASPTRSPDAPYRGFRIEALAGRDTRLGEGGAR
jgi:type II secretory pathway pseudopilin PulG